MLKQAVLLIAGVLVVVGCSSGSTTSGSGASLRCYQKASRPDGSDPDCVAKNLPRKLDCDTAADKQVALSYGCQEEGLGDMDVCCPTTVIGAPDKGSSGSSGTIVETAACDKAGTQAQPCKTNADCLSNRCTNTSGNGGSCDLSGVACSGDSECKTKFAGYTGSFCLDNPNGGQVGCSFGCP